MAEPETEYRTCLFCYTEIEAGRSNKTNFCNGTCQWKFRAGMSVEQYRFALDVNSRIPIRGNERRPKAKVNAERMVDSQLFKLCKLSEYNLCNTKFFTNRTSKLFCHYKHQSQYNNLKYKERQRQAKQKEDEGET